MLSGSESRSFSAWRLFAALGIVAVVSIGAYADSTKKAATVDTRPVPFKSASAQQGLTLTSPANLTATQSLEGQQTAAFSFLPVPSQGPSRHASGGGAACNDYQLDDGATETSVGFGVPAVTVWANLYTAAAGLETVGVVATAFGSVLGGNEDLVGKPFSAGIWSDPNQDGDPSDGALLSWGTSVVEAGTPDTDTFQIVDIADVTFAVGENFFVLAWMQGDAFPAPVDTDTASAGRAWVNGNVGAVFDPDAIEDGGWDEITIIPDFDGVWLIRACTGGGAVCGNGVVEGFEECDGNDDAACPGDCEDDCTCAIFGACCNPGGKVGGCDPNQTQDECEGQVGGGDWLDEDSTCLDCVCENATESCLEEHPEPGCSDSACCSTVCDEDPFCCTGLWDGACVDSAIENCVDTCGNGLCGPAENCGSCSVDCGICPGCPASNCAAGVMSQSVSQEIVPISGVACGNGAGQTTPNAWARCFDPVSEGWKDEGGGAATVLIESVDFGFETSAAGGSLPVFANVYLDLNGCPADGFGTGNAILLGTAETELPAGGDGALLNAEFVVPLLVELPVGAGLIVEFEYLLDGTDDTNPLGLFGVWPGANSTGQCGPSMLRAASCGCCGDWTDLGPLGFPLSHNVIVVHAIVVDPVKECDFIPECPDGLCQAEDCGSCPEDCPCPDGTQCDGDSCETFCGNGTCDADETCEICELDCGACDDCGYECDSDLTQSTDPVSDSENQIACGLPDGGGTTENAWARCFDLSENGLTDDVQVDSITWGIQQADDGPDGGPVSDILVDLNLYIDHDGCPASGFGTGNAELIASTQVLVGTADIGDLITTEFNTLVPPVVPAGSSIIVEISTPVDGTDDPIYNFRSLSNDAGQCRANYLRAADCGNNDWTDMGTIGDPPFVDTHLAISVSMSCVGGCNECKVDVDGSGNVGPLDLATLLGCWGPTVPGCECVDVDGSGNVGPLDLATLLGSWGPCPLP